MSVVCKCNCKCNGTFVGNWNPAQRGSRLLCGSALLLFAFHFFPLPLQGQVTVQQSSPANHFTNKSCTYLCHIVENTLHPWITQLVFILFKSLIIIILAALHPSHTSLPPHTHTYPHTHIHRHPPHTHTPTPGHTQTPPTPPHTHTPHIHPCTHIPVYTQPHNSLPPPPQFTPPTPTH